MANQLINYLDGCILKDYEEIQEILRVEQIAEEAIWKELDYLKRESKVQDSEDDGLKHWEGILEFKPLDTDTVDVRRLRIKGKLNETLPYTYRVICSMLESLCGEDGVEVDRRVEDYTFSVKVALKSKKLKAEVEKLLDRVLPENMILKVSLKYNTWGMVKKLTWGQLKQYTWQQVKEGDLIAENN